MFKKYLQIIVVISAICAGACNQEKQVEYTEDKDTVKAQSPNLKRRTFPFRTELVSRESLQLAGATSFEMTLSGCSSGQTATITDASLYLEMYEFDRHCVVKLTKFMLNDKEYTPKPGSLFTTWAAGDKAVFRVALDPSDELALEVITTVSDPVVAGGAIKYQFSEKTRGTDKILDEAVVRESQTLEVSGQAAPQFAIKQVQLVGIDGTTGNGSFRFQMECEGHAVVDTGNDMKCYDVLLRQVEIVLTQDTYGGNPMEQDLIDMFAVAGAIKRINTATDVFIPNSGSPNLVNGGFITAAASDAANVVTIATTAPISTNPNMLLVFRAGPSYLYFSVVVTTITQSGSPP